ncbi:ABC transporter permease [Rhodococcus sp. CX]|uniref:MlaE family ABC transporter permease n=1 Tax=Rhodococcus sp. CX TaxID=2789880 RepID=UPI0018CCFD69|nr:ABC transporter permease [Rhodococcus sp. CX]MBH0119317.1 ABC transporter permease [Rhodococcus sp. CX]
MVDLLEVPLRAVGGLFAMTGETARAAFSRPFQRREFIDQAWFVARVSLLPTVLVAVPFTVLVSFTLNILLREIGAADLSGAGAALGAGATAICADLAARTIREEIDAMRVLGINPIHRLVVPRVLASTVVALLLNGLVCSIGILGGFAFSVFLQDVNPGAFVNGITLLTGFGELIISQVKAGLFGMIAGLVASYLGLNVKGGAKSVGDAVNQTVVFAFMALFVVNLLVTAVGIKLTAG